MIFTEKSKWAKRVKLKNTDPLISILSNHITSFGVLPLSPTSWTSPALHSLVAPQKVNFFPSALSHFQEKIAREQTLIINAS